MSYLLNVERNVDERIVANDKDIAALK